MAGKLNGVIAANTPIGIRSTSPSIAPAQPTILSPCWRIGTPQATSMFWNTRFISARESGSDLPISSVSRQAIFSSFSLSK